MKSAMAMALGLAALAGSARGQFSFVFKDGDHYEQWLQQNENNIKAFAQPTLVVCFKSSGTVHLLQFATGTDTVIGTRKDCKGSTDFNNNALPYIDLVKAIQFFSMFGLPPSPRPEIRPEAAPASSLPPTWPLYRAFPFLPGYPDSVVSGVSPTCNSANRGAYLLVDHQNSSLTVAQECNGQQFGTDIALAGNALQAAVTPDGTLALVTSFDGAVNFIDLTTLKRTATLATPNDNPSGIAISNDGSTAYVTSFTNSGALLTIDIAGRKVTNRLPLPGYPQSVVLSPDDSLAWVMFPFTDTITVVDTLTGTVAKNLQISSPYGVAFNAAGTRAYVSNRSQGTVQVIDTATYQTVKSIPVGNGPVEILVSPDDTYAVVSNFDGASLTAFDLNSYATTTLKLPDQPLGMAFVQ